MPRGMGHRDMLLQTTACLTQEIGLFACRLQGDVEAQHGADFKAPKQVLLSPAVQLGQCFQAEGMEVPICMPWDVSWGAGSG